MTDEKKKVWEKMSKADLITELGRYDKKVKDQAKEIKFRNGQIREMEGQLKEMSVIVDSVMDRLIDRYGRYGYGGEFISLPAAIRDGSAYERYGISAGGLHIMVRRKREES